MVRELITVEGVDRSFGPTDVLQDINLIVNDGDRIGIVGHNGAGKTTLLNTISDQKQDVGDIDFAPGIRIAYLTQIRDIESDSTIEEELGRKGRQFQELEDEITSIEAQMVDPSFYEGDWEPVMERYSELQQTLASSGGGNVAGIAKGTALPGDICPSACLTAVNAASESIKGGSPTALLFRMLPQGFGSL